MTDKIKITLPLCDEEAISLIEGLGIRQRTSDSIIRAYWACREHLKWTVDKSYCVSLGCFSGYEQKYVSMSEIALKEICLN